MLWERSEMHPYINCDFMCMIHYSHLLSATRVCSGFHVFWLWRKMQSGKCHLWCVGAFRKCWAPLVACYETELTDHFFNWELAALIFRSIAAPNICSVNLRIVIKISTAASGCTQHLILTCWDQKGQKVRSFRSHCITIVAHWHVHN